MDYFLGVDVGGSKSEALLASEDGQALAFARGGPGNHQWVGLEGLADTLADIVHQVLEQANLRPVQVQGAGFGIAGYDWPTDHPPIEKIIKRLGLSCPQPLVNDTLIALAAGASAGWGVALVAGTSGNCRGRDAQGREGRVVGEGVHFGEYGGADALVFKAVQTVAAAWTRCGPPSALSELLIRAAGASDIADLLEGLARMRYYLGPATAQLVFQAAASGDRAAEEIVAWLGDQLGEMALSVIRQLELQPLEFEVVLSGSIFRGSESLLQPLRARLQGEAPGARLVRLQAPPVVGGVLLGMQAAGIDPAPLRQPLIESTRRII